MFTNLDELVSGFFDYLDSIDTSTKEKTTVAPVKKEEKKEVRSEHKDPVPEIPNVYTPRREADRGIIEQLLLAYGPKVSVDYLKGTRSGDYGITFKLKASENNIEPITSNFNVLVIVLQVLRKQLDKAGLSDYRVEYYGYPEDIKDKSFIAVTLYGNDHVPGGITIKIKNRDGGLSIADFEKDHIDIPEAFQ